MKGHVNAIGRAIHKWFLDVVGIFNSELREVLLDEGVMLILLVAGFLYPILYNVMYSNGTLDDIPIAVVDDAHCSESARILRELDACREVNIACECMNMEEAKTLLQKREVNGIIYIPSDFGRQLNQFSTAVFSIYADMSSFLYYKDLLMSSRFVMLQNVRQIQIDRYSALGMTAQEASQLTKPILYEENNPYNRNFSYSIFLISAILLLIVQQCMFVCMSISVGTMREQNRNFSSLVNKFSGRGVSRVVLGRGAAYWLLFMIIGVYIATIVPAMFDFPQRGSFEAIFVLLLFFVTDCVFFCMTWSSLMLRRESVFLLFMFASPVCLFLTGFSWPTTAFPPFWKYFSYIFPSTFACQAFINVNTAGGDLSTISEHLTSITIQTVIYYFIASLMIYVENFILEHREQVKAINDQMTEMIIIRQNRFREKVDARLEKRFGDKFTKIKQPISDEEN